MNGMLKRAGLSILGLSLSMLLAAGASQAQDAYPSKPVRLVVPFAAGGSTDILARLIADNVDLGGTRLVVENKPGAGGLIAFNEVKNAAPDGYTLALTNPALTSGPFLRKEYAIDGVKDFTPIARLSTASLILSVNPELPVDSMSGLIAYSKANPDALNIPVLGGQLDFDVAMLEKATGMTLVRIPYQGAAPALQALVAGEVQLQLDLPVSSMPLIGSGMIRPIAVGSAERLRMLPDVPTLAESGVQNLTLTTTWFGIAGPAGLPQEVTETLTKAIAAALRKEAVAKRIGELGMDVAPGGPDELRETMLADQKRFAEAASIGGISPQ